MLTSHVLQQVCLPLYHSVWCACRDIDMVLDGLEKGESFYLYICIRKGASLQAMHLEHLVLFMLTK